MKFLGRINMRKMKICKSNWLAILLVVFTNNLYAQEHASRILGSPYPVSSVPDTIFVTQDNNFTESELFTINSLQGLLAKERPKIYRDHGQGYSLWIKDIEENYSVKIDNRFLNDFNGLIQHFKSKISGYVLCNLHDNSSNAAISICGLLNAIAITSDQVSLMGNLGIGQIEDVRLKDESWAFNKYANQFSTKILCYQKEGKDLFLGDYSVFTNAFYFFENIGSYLTDRAFSRMDDNSIMLGWGDDEYQTVAIASNNSVMVNAADWALNLSTLSNFNVETKQKNHLDTLINKEGVHTVCFVMTDGDNVQWLLNDFATNQNWFGSPDRGKVSIGWTISPALCELAPTVMKYLYDRSSNSENGRDYFIAGPSGIGYFYPEQYPAMNTMTQSLNEYMKKSDLNILNVISDNGSLETVKPFLNQESIDAIFLYTYASYSGLAGKIMWYNGKPIIGGRFELRDGAFSPESLASNLNGMPRNPNSPDGYSLIPVHVWSESVNAIKTCASLLDNHVRVVAPDEFIALIKNNLSNPSTTADELPKVKNDNIKLLQNYPNPAHGSTTITYYLPKNVEKVELAVFNTNGQLLCSQVEWKRNIGKHDFNLSTAGLNPGTYIYKLITDGNVLHSVAKIMLVK